MGWEQSTFTRGGLALISQCLNEGKALEIVAAPYGSGVTPASQLADLTDLSGARGDMILADIGDTADNSKLLVMEITSQGVTEAFQLRQIGVYARAGSAGTPKLLFVMQDETGLTIPTQGEQPNFVLTVRALLGASLPADTVIRQELQITVRDGAVTLAKLGADVKAKLSALMAEDALLETRIDEIIAPTGGAPSEAEVTDARIGYDATVYPSLGAAVRGQAEGLRNSANAIDLAAKHTDCGIQICPIKPVTLAENPSASDSTRVGLTRVGNVVTLKGSVASDKTYYMRMNGSPTRTVYSSTVKSWSADPAVLIVGHKYRLTLKHLNGTKQIENIAIAPYAIGSVAAEGYRVIPASGEIDNSVYICDFIAKSAEYNIVITVNNSASFAEDTYVYSLTDVTARTEEDPLNQEVNAITEWNAVPYTVAKIATSSGVFAGNNNARTIRWKCSPGRSYLIDKKVLTYEFYVGWTEALPANGVSYTSLFNAQNETKVVVTAPLTAQYLYAYIYNRVRSPDSTLDPDELTAAVEVVQLTGIDTEAREKIDFIDGYMQIDISDAIKWSIGSLGSNGENYPRDYELRTYEYLPFESLYSVTFDIPLNTRICAYNSNKKLLHRYQETERSGVNLQTIKSQYPKTEYIRFTIYTDSTPLVDTSLSENVTVIRTATLTKADLNTISNLESPDVLSLHKDSLTKATTFKLQRTSNEQFGNAALRLMFFTDVHNEPGRVGRAVELLNGWGSDYFDVAVNGGDTTYGVFDAAQLAKYDDQIAMSSIPVLNTIGNHDAYSTLDGARPLVEPTTIYNAITAKVKENVPAIVQPANAATAGLNYYYYDTGPIRIIILDCMYWDAAELAWFEAVLADAVTNQKAVIAVSHYNFVADAVDYVTPCVWNPHGYAVGGSANFPMPISAAEAVKAFQDGGGEFVIWLCGHSHGDAIKKLKPEYGNQFQLICPAFVNRAGTVYKNSDPYAYNYDCLTYIVVDTYYKIVRGMRIGANINEEGEEYHTFAINYGTGEFLSSC